MQRKRARAANRHTEQRMVRKPCTFRHDLGKGQHSICASLLVSVVFSGQRRVKTTCYMCNADRKGVSLIDGNKPRNGGRHA
jgi:hypothetical protein